MAYSHLVMSCSMICFSVRFFVYKAPAGMLSLHVGHLKLAEFLARVMHPRQNVCPSWHKETGSLFTSRQMLHSRFSWGIVTKMLDGNPPCTTLLLLLAPAMSLVGVLCAGCRRVMTVMR